MAFEMTKMMEREMQKYTENVVKEMTKYLAQEYGFNGEEAVEKLMGKGMKKSTDEEVPVKDEVKKFMKRGRPKKEKKVVSANAADDLIANLVAQAQQTQAQHAADDFIASLVAQAQSQQASASEEVDTSEEADALEDALAVKAEADALAVKEKDVKEQAKLAKKAQQEQDKLAKKAQQEQDKLAKKAQQEKEKELAKLAKKAQQEKEKELAKLAKKAQQEQDKLANGGKGAAPPQEQDKLANGGKGAAPPQEQDKLANGGKGAAPPQEEKMATPSAIEELSSQMGQLELEEESVEEEASISVKKFEFQGTVYLRSSDDVLYDLKSQEPVGMWNEEEQCIDEIEVEED